MCVKSTDENVKHKFDKGDNEFCILHLSDLHITGTILGDRFKRLFKDVQSKTKSVKKIVVAKGTYNDKVHNIALTGSYGAGKSSILASYIKWRSIKNPVIKFLASKIKILGNFLIGHEQKKFLNISLATFALENNGELPEDKTQEIEKSILQQFFYKKPGNKFPYSRFNRIKTLSLFKVFVIETIIGVFTVFCLKY